MAKPSAGNGIIVPRRLQVFHTFVSWVGHHVVVHGFPAARQRSADELEGCELPTVDTSVPSDRVSLYFMSLILYERQRDCYNV